MKSEFMGGRWEESEGRKKRKKEDGESLSRRK
jgi:hypothetical protein